jgi:hypothetical protein
VANLSEVLRFGAILAPFSGVVTSRAVDIGALVSAGAATGNRALLTLVQTDTLRVLINVPQSAATNVRIGQKATMDGVQELGNAQFEGRVALTARAFECDLAYAAHRGAGAQHGSTPDARHVFSRAAVRTRIRRWPPHTRYRADHSRRRPAGGGGGERHRAVGTHQVGTRLRAPFSRCSIGVTVGAQIIVNPSEQLMTGSKVRAIARGTPATDAPKP